MKISEHFNSDEFRCKCAQKGFSGDGFCGGESKVDLGLVAILEAVRTKFNARRVTITSGYRCEAYNKIIGGAPKSQHCEGIAADFQVFDQSNVMVSPRVIAEYLDDEYPETYGIGKYPYWVHLDVRKTRARWAK